MEDRVALAPREKFLRVPMLQFISTKLVYRRNGKLLIKTDSSFQISLR